MIALEFNNISKSFREDFWKSKNDALSELSFSIREEKVTGFLGRNGAGKTTLIKILLGFISADRGKVVYSKNIGKNFNEFRFRENG